MLLYITCRLVSIPMFTSVPLVMAAVCINREPLRRWREEVGKEGRKKGNGAFSPFPIFIEMLTSVPSVMEAATRTVSTLAKGRDPWGEGRGGEGRGRGREEKEKERRGIGRRGMGEKTCQPVKVLSSSLQTLTSAPSVKVGRNLYLGVE